MGTTARYPVDQALSLLAKMSKRGAVYAQRAEQIGVMSWANCSGVKASEEPKPMWLAL